MTEKKFKFKIVLTFATMLVMAMLLQSMVVMFLGVRASIREDVAWAKKTLQHAAVSAEANEDILGNDIFSCSYLESSGAETTVQPPCRYTDQLRTLSQQARVQNKAGIAFAGAGWNTFLFGNEMVLIAVPLVNTTGQVIGSLAAERSLLPIYSRYEQDVKIILCYFLVNALLFSTLSFFRVAHLFFRPLDSLIQKAETYRPDEQELFLVSDNESPFRKLSASLNTLFARIERDNRTLRQNLCVLEEVNAALKENKDLVVRSEKLATAGRLSAGLAHEIGNPLSIIQGYVELLGRDDLSGDEKRQFSEKAEQELDRIKRLIRQLLDFSAPNRLETEAVLVNSLINDVVSFATLEKNFAQASIRTEFHTTDDAVVSDKDAFKQVLLNCLFNAADATASLKDRQRSIVIATSQEQNSKLQSQLVIRMRDNGTGIAEEQRQYLFDPFFTTKEVGRGTGLGLFVCHTIMERLQGTITLDNVAPTGVEVRITLPLHRLAQVEQ
jgi:two-component system, NtrC family, sensor kinase